MTLASNSDPAAQPESRLRQQIAEALRSAPAGRRATNPLGEHGTGHQYDGACALCRADVDGLADAVLAIVQPLLTRARERVAWAQADREQLREQLSAIQSLADRWDNALAVDKPYARALRAAGGSGTVEG